MASSLFQLPDELILNTLAQAFPCRDAQIRALATLLHVKKSHGCLDFNVVRQTDPSDTK